MISILVRSVIVSNFHLIDFDRISSHANVQRLHRKQL